MHRILAALGAVLVGVAMATLAIVYGFAISRTIDGYETAEREYAQLQCLGVSIRDQVPAGAVVFVADWGGTGYGFWGKDVYWMQRITELTYPERALTVDATRADVVIRLTHDDEGPCDGFSIEMTQP